VREPVLGDGAWRLGQRRAIARRDCDRPSRHEKRASGSGPRRANAPSGYSHFAPRFASAPSRVDRKTMTSPNWSRRRIVVTSVVVTTWVVFAIVVAVEGWSVLLVSVAALIAAWVMVFNR
jgi:hypothetical protein